MSVKFEIDLESLFEHLVDYTEHYPDSQAISQQELRIRVCCMLRINIVNACFDHRYSSAVLQTEV